MAESIFSLIDAKYNHMSKTLRVVGDYIKDNYLVVSFLSISELSERIGVSPPSITRFSQSLGFSGYPELQKQIQMVMKKEITPMKEIKNSIVDDMDDEDVLSRIINLNIQNLKDTYCDNLNESFRKAVELINGARTLYIIGLRSSYCAAYYLHFMLQQFKDNVVLLTSGTEDIFDKISYIDKGDVLFAIGFQKYTKLTCNIVEYFKANSIDVIGLTDNFSSPVSIKADVSLLAKNSSSTYSFVSAMAILNALIISVGRKNREKTLETMKFKQKVLIKNNIYI